MPDLLANQHPSLVLDTPASQQFHAWLEAFNAQDREKLAAYHASNFPYDVASDDVANIDRELGLSRGTGGFHIIEVEKSSKDGQGDENDTIVVLLREKQQLQFARAMMQVDPSQRNYPVSKFEIAPTVTPIKYVPEERKKEYEKALAPPTPETRHKVVSELCEVVRQRYIFPEVGEKMISQLRAKELNGEYSEYTNSEEWAKCLTKDMIAVSKDKHIRIVFAAPPARVVVDGDGDDHNVPPEFFDVIKDHNFGFRAPSVEVIRGQKIGLLPIDGFVPSLPSEHPIHEKIRKAIGDIVSRIADADALLIDLRMNHGGDPSTVAFVLSYFLDDGPVHLNDFVDRNGTVKKSFSTLPAAELPNGTARFGGSKPVYVLTSKDTVSGGEDMAYDLQALRRARAVVGTSHTTAGAANPVMERSTICEEGFGKDWWHVAIPDMQPVNAVTKGNWEGVGVKSDIVVEQDQDPVDVATRLAMKELEAGIDVVVQGD